ncbi:hypothetical protein ZWY2020_011906 [Hordeum vulgare]|nr:hypothetical protein ZWY2020_011906 [Hordeum vulgare]
MMRGLKLSEEERRGVKIKVPMKEKGKSLAAQAVGKVLSERLAHPDAIRLSLGRVWCPIKGTDCKEVGENLFVFTFNQESGKRRALEDGPWMFEKDLMMVEDYGPRKKSEDYEFNETHIWVRIFNLPLGMMNAESAEEIGNIVGNFVEADVGADGIAMGKFMRATIRMKLDKPIILPWMMRSTNGANEGEDGAWCRFEYEFLPDFCYICGFVGHGEKACNMKLAKGEKAQFVGWLRADMGRRKLYEEEEGNWRGRGRGSGGARPYGTNRSYERSVSGSDSLSWRKDGSRSTNGKLVETEKGEEVTSPSKQRVAEQRELGHPKKLLLVGHIDGVGVENSQEEGGGKHVPVEIANNSSVGCMKKNPAKVRGSSGDVRLD